MSDCINREDALNMICGVCDVVPVSERETCPYKFTGCKEYSVIVGLPAADVLSAADVNAAVDEALRVLDGISNQMPYSAYSALFDALCNICGADGRKEV